MVRGRDGCDRRLAEQCSNLFAELPHPLQYRVLVEQLAVCRLAAEAHIPDWALQGGFFCVMRTPDELSIVCANDLCPADPLPQRASAERGWLALKLEGPFPFLMTGVLASFVQPLAEAQIPIFAISTFDTDYVLIKRAHIEQAVLTLAAAGHKKIEETTA
jgi:uncharacterized protein